MGAKGEWGGLIAALRDAGYECLHTKSGHVQVYNAEGKRVWQMPLTASDHRSYLNTLRDLKRRIGFEMPPRNGRKGKGS